MREKTNNDKAFEGTLKKSRIKNTKVEPLARLGKPTFDLDEYGLRVFKETGKLLISTKTLTALDISILTLFAFNMSLFIRTNINTKGIYVQKFKGGATNITGEYSIIKDTQKQIQIYAKLLGLSVKDRGLISAFMESEKEEDDNPFEDIMNALNDKE